jgi:hypothetical protein
MVLAPTGTVRPAVALNREEARQSGGLEAEPASLGSAGTPSCGETPSHVESYADAAVKSTTCAREHAAAICRIGGGFQTARSRSTIGNMNLAQRQREALRKEKRAAKREKREARRQQKAAPPAKS